ncbi:MAG: hypothetical protein WDN45_19055 [Caulobacteraceae bacterium]
MRDQLEPAHARHLHVEQEAIETVDLAGVQQGFARAVGPHVEPGKGQQVLQRGAEGRIVVDHGDQLRTHFELLTSGSPAGPGPAPWNTAEEFNH